MTRHACAKAAGIAVLASATALIAADPDSSCRADLDGDGELTVFDFLEFQNRFDAGDLAADFDGDGELTIFDFLEFQNEFDLGCPVRPVNLQMAGVPLSGFPWFEATRAFNQGETVFLAIDPDRFPAVLGETSDIYVVASKTDDQWSSDPTLIDVRGMPQEHVFSAASIVTAPVALIGSESLASADGLSVSTGYDLVVDMDGDGRLGEGDYIDGRGVLPADSNGFSVFTDMTQPGPLTPVVVDTRNSVSNIRLNYPLEIGDVGPLPIAIIVHGGGHDYRWYDYLQNQLSSWGWVSISVVNRFRERGEPLLLHTDALVAEQDTIGGGVLDGQLDASRIAWIGHSRGGLEVILASERLTEGDFIPDNYDADDIVLASAIAAVSSGGIGTDVDPGDINFHMIWGAADGDVDGSSTGILGLVWPLRSYELADGFKHSTYIHGVDHNDFNCCGFNDFEGPPDTEIGREQAQRIALSIWLSLLSLYADGNGDAIDFVTRPWDAFKPLGVLQVTTLAHMYRPDPVMNASRVIDDFQTNPSTSQSSSGGDVIFTTTNTTEVLQADDDRVYSWQSTDPANGMTLAFFDTDDSRGLVFDFDGPASIEWEVLPSLQDLIGYDHLSFRVCQGTRHPNTVAELAPAAFDVTLIDGRGTESTIHIGAYKAGATEPYQRTGGGAGAGWQNEYNTIRIRLTDFLAQGTGLDLGEVVAIRFDFGVAQGTRLGRLGLDELEFTVDP